SGTRDKAAKVQSAGPTSPGASAAASTTIASAPDPAKAERAKAAVFQPSDFPAGWTAGPEAGDGPDPQVIWGDVTRCLGLPSAAAAAAVATSPTFLRGLATQAQSTVELADAARAMALTSALTGPAFGPCAKDAFAADVKRNAPEGATPGAVE